jgi:hypothetical protein
MSRFEPNTQSREPFGVPEMMQIAEPESTRDDVHPIATSSASVGRVKRLLKIPDQMRPELERDQPFTGRAGRQGRRQRSTTRVCCYRCREPFRSEIRTPLRQVAALAMPEAVDPIVRGGRTSLTPPEIRIRRLDFARRRILSVRSLHLPLEKA